jgi:hypothetical protein
MADTENKKKLTPFQRFVSAIARVPKEELRKVEEAEKDDKPKRKSA